MNSGAKGQGQRNRPADQSGSDKPSRAEVAGHLLIAIGTFLLYYYGVNSSEGKD